MILKTPGQIVRAVIVIVAAALLLGFVFASLAKSVEPQTAHRDFEPIYDEFIRHCKLHKNIPGYVIRSDTISIDDTTWYLVVEYLSGFAVRVFIQRETLRDHRGLLEVMFDGMERPNIGKVEWGDFCRGHNYSEATGVIDKPDCAGGSIWSEGIELFKKKYMQLAFRWLD